MWKRKIRHLLKKTLESENPEVPAISMRSLAKAVRMSPGALSEIIRGRRNISERSAFQIIEGLQLDPAETEKLKAEVSSQVNGVRNLLSKDAIKLIEKWFYSSILCHFELVNPPKDEEDLAVRLGLPLSEIKAAVEFLIQAQMLERNELGQLELIGSYWTTTDEISSEVVRNAHAAELQVSERFLQTVPMEERDFTSITFAGNSQQLARVKKEIRSFRDRISHIMAEGDSDQVYKFNVQFFPVNLNSREKNQ